MSSSGSIATSDKENLMDSEMFSENSSTSSSPYWKYFDSVMLRSEQEIKNEFKFLGETTYSIKNFDIFAGISVARGLTPSVKIFNTALNLPKGEVTVSFDDAEWSDFLEIIKSFLDTSSHDDSEITKTVDSLTENFTVSTTIFLGERLIKLYSREVNLYLTMGDVRSILYVQDIVNYRLCVLQNLDFRTYYANILNYYNVPSVSETNCINAIKEYCYLAISELSYFMLEFIHVNPNKIIMDFNKIIN